MTAIAPIVRLLYRSCPFAILGGVRSIIINAFNRMAISRSAPHIRKKLPERTCPAFTDGDASRTIITIARVFRIQHSVFQLLPDAIFGTVGHAMCRFSFAYLLAPEASAALTRPFSQTVRKGSRFLPTVTQTNPSLISFIQWGFSQDSQSSKTLTRGNWGNTKRLSHWETSISQLVRAASVLTTLGQLAHSSIISATQQVIKLTSVGSYYRPLIRGFA